MRFTRAVALRGGDAYHLACGDHWPEEEARLRGGRFCIAAVGLVLALSRAAAGAAAFADVTAAVGLTGLGATAAAWGDYNNDGWADLYVNGRLWRNESGRFARVGDAPLNGDGGLWGDYDNDGWLDLYCWGNGKLFRNVAGRSFVEVSGLLPARPMKFSRGAVWGDFNGDGFLDLYVGGYEIWKTQEEFPDVVYLNRQGKSFTEVWRTKGKPRRARGITAADFDEDGDLDIYVSNYRLQANTLWRNDGKGVFQDVAPRCGAAGDGDRGAWGHTIGSAWGDFDNDGHFDLFVGNFSHRPADQDRPKFLRNLGPEGRWRFRDKSATAGLRWQESYASPSPGDFDNDGNLDFFFTTVYTGDKSVLYRNRGDWRFTEVTGEAGVATANTYQSAWADFDNDGDLDLVSGGRLFRNPGNANHWLKVRLAGGGRVNRAAVGSQVRIRLPGKTLTRQVEGATGEGNQNDLTLHFGLGAHAGQVELLIRWTDGAGSTVTTDNNRLVTVRRGE
ncbi:MAG: CRTAC1 family protein [Verrucomicrobiota bacterium]